jgi:hypothetical protein
MNALILIAQSFFEHQTRLQTENLKHAGLRAAEVGRRMAIAGVFFSLSGAFIFSAILIAVIDFGLQIDRAHSVSFSGLMISSSVLASIGLASALAGWLVGREPKSIVAPPAPPISHSGELRPLLEAVAVSLLREFLEHQKKNQTPNQAAPAAEHE